MGWSDSWDFITGKQTDNEKAAEKAARDRRQYDGQWESPEQKAAAEDNLRRRYTDPTHPDYQGPGWQLTSDGGFLSAKLVDVQANEDWKLAKSMAAGAPPANPNPPPEETINKTLDQVTPPKRAPVDVAQAISKSTAAPANTFKAPSASKWGTVNHGQSIVDTYLGELDTSGFKTPAAAGGGGAAAPKPKPGEAAPDIDRTRVDPLLTGITEVQQKLLALANETKGMSAAEAALHKASREADIRSQIATEASQRGALGAARSARNRGDRALLERQAIGEQAFIGQEAARNDALRQAEQEGNLSILRANEEDADRRFKADVLGKAAELGLNTAALEVDISKADLGSANNWINNEFDKLKQQGQLDLGYAQLDQAKTESILGFTKDMATIQYEYDKMSVEDQNAADALLMQKYGIDQQTFVALKQIKEAGKFRWDQVLTQFVGGAATGGTSAIASTLLNDDKPKT